MSITSAAYAPLPTLEALVQEIVDHALSSDLIVSRLRGDLADLARLANAKPVAEGLLIEEAVRRLAASNSKLTLLAAHPLPLLPAALELARRNTGELISGVSFDSTTKTTSTYLPDVVAFDSGCGIVHLIDVKRSLGHYNTGRVEELKLKMLAAALVVPDAVWRVTGVPVQEVRIAIIDASGRSSPMAEGVVPLAELDQLIGVQGATAAIDAARALFDARVQLNFDDARRRFARLVGSRSRLRRAAAGGTPSEGAGDCAVVDVGAGRGGPRLADREAQIPGIGAPLHAFRIGFARRISTE